MQTCFTALAIIKTSANTQQGICDGLGTAESATRLDAPTGDVELRQTARCRSCYISGSGGRRAKAILVLIQNTDTNLQALVSFLTPDDLVVLTLISQAFHKHIRMDDANAKANLLSKTLCPGIGYFARAISHCICSVKTFEPIVHCAGLGFATESRPCAKCGVNTCDECRIHVLYNFLT